MTAGEIAALAIALAALAWLVQRMRRGGDDDHAPAGGCGDCKSHEKERGAAHEARRAAMPSAVVSSIRRDP